MPQTCQWARRPTKTSPAKTAYTRRDSGPIIQETRRISMRNGENLFVVYERPANGLWSDWSSTIEAAVYEQMVHLFPNVRVQFKNKSE